jgi:hypothetical protein
MLKKKINILIVGCGKMGTSHLKSFIGKSHINLYLYDKFKSKLIKYQKSKNIQLLNNINLKIKFDFCIVSTDSRDRYKVFKKLAFQKKIKIFLLEKFMFLKKKDYIFVKNNFNTQKILNNVWGKFIYQKTVKYNLDTYESVKIYIREGHLLTNLIHFMNFFSCYQKYLKIIKYNLKLLKFKSYHEYIGNFVMLFTKQKIIMETKNISDDFEMNFIKKKKIFKIILKKDSKIYLYLNSKLLKIIKFPLASFFSYKIFKCNTLVPNFTEILDDNLNVLKMVEIFSLKKKLVVIR